MKSILSLLLVSASFSFTPAYAATQATGLAGTVTISHSLQKKIGEQAALYIIARPDGAQSGPPAAVKRIPAPLKFPLSFVLTGADSMLMPGANLSGKFTLSARISQSGSATPIEPGDIQTGTPVRGVTAGGKSAKLVLNEVRK